MTTLNETRNDACRLWEMWNVIVLGDLLLSEVDPESQIDTQKEELKTFRRDCFDPRKFVESKKSRDVIEGECL
jgi:hypothetical protein